MDLPKISEEQFEIIRHLENFNIVVDSVAGSGKTTTNLYIAKYFETKKILLLTYNSKLKIETREKVKSLKIKNLETHSYHSFCVKYYDHKCFTDTEIKNILKSKIVCKTKINYDVILLDEAQDMTDLYYELICKINKDNAKNAKICLLGDEFQSIYDFNNADKRYITYADKIFNFNETSWKKCCLSVSFRVTNKIADFINNIMLNSDRLKTTKNSVDKPKYIICDIFPNRFDKYDVESYKPYIEISNFLEKGYKPQEIFILAPSLKSIRSPVRLFENCLKTNLPKLPVYVPSSEEEKLDENVIKNKLVFSTFHQAKGLERKVVFIFGFDNGYFKYYKPSKNEFDCPNELYVATTRAKEHLVMFHHCKNDYLPFLNKSKLEKFSIKEECCFYEPSSEKKINNEIGIQVTNMIKHLPQDIIDKCIKYLEIKNIRKINDKINIPHKIKNKTFQESVSEINGIGIPALFEFSEFGNTGILDYCINFDKSHKCVNDLLLSFQKKHIKKLMSIKKNKTFEENFLYVSTIYNSLNSGYLFKSCQIDNFNWIKDDISSKCLDRMLSLKITKNAQFEKSAMLSNMQKGDVPELLNRKICGRYDCVDGDIIYEFKCTEKLEKEHYLQLAIYMYVDKINLLRNKKNSFKNNINVDDKITYNFNDEMQSGEIKKIFKNGKMSVINVNTNKTCKIEKKDIVDFSRRYLLYNVLTDQLDEIICDVNKLKNMVKFLIYHKFINDLKNTDDLFIKTAIKINNKYRNDFEKGKIKDFTSKSKTLFLDVETTGFPTRSGFDQYYNPQKSEHYDTSRIIEIGYILCNKKCETIKKVKLLIKPQNFVIKNSHVHGITNKMATDKGIYINEALDILEKDLENVNKIVAHNILFDKNVLLSECYRNNYLNLAMLIKNKQTRCTMKIGKIFMKKNKYPKLIELYKHLFNKKIKQKHRALLDAKICKDCYYKLKRKKAVII